MHQYKKCPTGKKRRSNCFFLNHPLTLYTITYLCTHIVATYYNILRQYHHCIWLNAVVFIVSPFAALFTGGSFGMNWNQVNLIELPDTSSAFEKMSIYWISCGETTHQTPEPDRGHPPKLWYPQGRPEFDDVLWGTSTLGQTLRWHTSSRSNANVHLAFHDSSHKLLGYGMIRYMYISICIYTHVSNHVWWIVGDAGCKFKSCFRWILWCCIFVAMFPPAGNKSTMLWHRWVSWCSRTSAHLRSVRWVHEIWWQFLEFYHVFCKCTVVQ